MLPIDNIILRNVFMQTRVDLVTSIVLQKITSTFYPNAIAATNLDQLEPWKLS
jgi:hypothetical protein